MVRVTVEVELPDDEVGALRHLAVMMCKSWERWRLLGIHKSTDPPCPQCGSAMEWDRDLAAYVCHHVA